MKTCNKATLCLFTISVAIWFSGCSDKRGYATGCETERFIAAVETFDSRFNSSDYEAIYNDFLDIEPGQKLFSRDEINESLKYLKEKYGNVVGRQLTSVSVRPSDYDCASVVYTTYEVKTEKGNYVTHSNWHTYGDGTKLAYFSLMEYGDDGKLYLNLRLRHGLNEEDVQDHKIRVR